MAACEWVSRTVSEMEKNNIQMRDEGSLAKRDGLNDVFEFDDVGLMYLEGVTTGALLSHMIRNCERFPPLLRLTANRCIALTN